MKPLCQLWSVCELSVAVRNGYQIRRIAGNDSASGPTRGQLWAETDNKIIKIVEKQWREEIEFRPERQWTEFYDNTLSSVA